MASQRFSALRAAVLAAWFLMGPTIPSVEVEAANVHLIVACDTSQASGLGADVVADRQMILRLFEENVPRRHLRLHVLEEPALNPDAILKTINGLQVERRRDSVVFYYSGHGAFDEKLGHFFALPNRGHILRSDIERAIIGKQPRTMVTITDCCTAGARFRGEIAIPKHLARPTAISPLFQHLLFDRYGTFSITSSQPGEVSITRGDGKGSLFTYPLVEFLSDNAKRRLSWSEVTEAVAKRVKHDFDVVTKKKGIDKDGDGVPDQWTQTVHAFIRTPALGARVRHRGGRLEVVQVIPLSPAEHAGMKVGDVLLAINGSPLSSEDDYDRAVDNSPRSIHLTLQRANGIQAQLSTELNR